MQSLAELRQQPLEITFEKMNTRNYSNLSGDEKIYELLNNFFILRKGLLTVSMVSSDQIELPFESELVSALWLVTASGDAKVHLGISHCMRLSVNNMNQVSMVMAKTDGKRPPRLVPNGEACFSSRNQYGTLELPSVKESATYLVGIVKQTSAEPSGLLSRLFRTSRFISQYSYLVFYQFRRQDRSVNYMHWRVHVLSFKNICGLSVRLLATIL